MPQFLFEDSQVLKPGMCDVNDCEQPARYALGVCYFCADCLIRAGLVGALPADNLTIYRLPMYLDPRVMECCF